MVTGIEIVDIGQTIDCPLVAGQSNLAMYFDATYSGVAPDYLLVDITVDLTNYIRGKALYYRDITSNKRRFVFDASDFIRPLIAGSIDDFDQSEGTVVETNVSRIINIIVKSDVAGTVQATADVEITNAIREKEEGTAMVDVYNNAEPPYFAIYGEPVYIYYYGGSHETETSYALDYDDGKFLDWNNDKFVIN